MPVLSADLYFQEEGISTKYWTFKHTSGSDGEIEFVGSTGFFFLSSSQTSFRIIK